MPSFSWILALTVSIVSDDSTLSAIDLLERNMDNFYDSIKALNSGKHKLPVKTKIIKN